MSLLIALPLLLLEAILQSTVLSHWRLFGGTLNLILITVLCWNIVADRAEGLVWALIGGVWADVLSALLDYVREQPENRYLTADVIGRDESPFLQFIVINKGSSDGLARDMPVVTEKGLVGQVTEVTANAAIVLLLTDPTAAVNARLQASRAEGVVVSTLTGDLRMEFISLDAQVNPGDIVVTSGLGGEYPPDLAIGQIVSVRKRTQDVFQEADLQPRQDFSALEVVLVLTNFVPVNLAPILGTPQP